MRLHDGAMRAGAARSGGRDAVAPRAVAHRAPTAMRRDPGNDSTPCLARAVDEQRQRDPADPAHEVDDLVVPFPGVDRIELVAPSLLDLAEQRHPRDHDRDHQRLRARIGEGAPDRQRRPARRRSPAYSSECAAHGAAANHAASSGSLAIILAAVQPSTAAPSQRICGKRSTHFSTSVDAPDDDRNRDREPDDDEPGSCPARRRRRRARCRRPSPRRR